MTADTPPQDGHRHHDECYACPVGGLFLTARGANPEAFEHLVNAAAEMVAATKVMVEAAERLIEQQRSPARPGRGGGGSRISKIDVEG